jgi:hypothetical protein
VIAFLAVYVATPLLYFAVRDGGALWRVKRRIDKETLLRIAAPALETDQLRKELESAKAQAAKEILRAQTYSDAVFVNGTARELVGVRHDYHTNTEIQVWQERRPIPTSPIFWRP